LDVPPAGARCRLPRLRLQGALKLDERDMPSTTHPPDMLQGALLKKIVEAIKDLVTDANLECSSTGLTMQVRFMAAAAFPL
jgi:hypothetical protein